MPAAKDQQLLTRQLAALSDMTRLRLLVLLETEELGVGELAAILQLPQSTVSRHLKSLLEGRWIARRSEGTASLYRCYVPNLSDQASELWALARKHLGQSAQLAQDSRRLTEVLARRRVDSAAYFGRVGSEWDAVRTELFGASFIPTALLSLIPSHWAVADLGCGTGNISELLAPIVNHVHAVDSSASMLSAAQERLKEHSNISYHHADLMDLPLDSSMCDAAVLSLVLHHIDEPTSALSEAARILKPEGRLLILDMVHHDREHYRVTMGHRWLGFTRDDLATWCAKSGLSLVRVDPLKPDPDAKGPDLFIAVAQRGNAAHPSRKNRT